MDYSPPPSSSSSASIQWADDSMEDSWTEKLAVQWAEISRVSSTVCPKPNSMSNSVYNECCLWRKAFPNRSQSSHSNSSGPSSSNAKVNCWLSTNPIRVQRPISSQVPSHTMTPIPTSTRLQLLRNRPSLNWSRHSSNYTSNNNMNSTAYKW